MDSIPALARDVVGDRAVDKRRFACVNVDSAPVLGVVVRNKAVDERRYAAGLDRAAVVLRDVALEDAGGYRRGRGATNMDGAAVL